MKAGVLASQSARALLRGFAAGAILLLGACGFHPRGTTPLPPAMAVTYIGGYDTLSDDFRDALESRGARVTRDPAKATAVLKILKNENGQHVLSVNLSGQVLEYLLFQRIEFEVTAADGRTLVKPQSVAVSRAMKFNVNGVLGSEREWESIRRELQRNVVSLAMLRIAAAGKP